jgi:hypothetical protein
MATTIIVNNNPTGTTTYDVPKFGASELKLQDSSIDPSNGDAISVYKILGSGGGAEVKIAVRKRDYNNGQNATPGRTILSAEYRTEQVTTTDGTVVERLPVKFYLSITLPGHRIEDTSGVLEVIAAVASLFFDADGGAPTVLIDKKIDDLADGITSILV